MIVKFKDGADRGAAVSSTMAQVAGTSAEQPSWADFEIVNIADSMDPKSRPRRCEPAATSSTRSPAISITPCTARTIRCTPNQWNFPAIDMERAWDIQPGASSNVIVAVLDTGVAFKNATIRYNSRFPFRLDPGGPVYPALGIVDVPFAIAPELGDRFVAPRDFIWDDNDPVDLDGHGTHVTGTIGQLDEQRHRRGRHGLQRPHHAGEGDLRDVGRHLRLTQRGDGRRGRARAFATRPTTAPR